MARSNKAVLIASLGFVLLFAYQNCSPVNFEGIDTGLSAKAGSPDAIEDGIKGEITDETNNVVIRQPEDDDDAVESNSNVEQEEMDDDDKDTASSESDSLPVSMVKEEKKSLCIERKADRLVAEIVKNAPAPSSSSDDDESDDGSSSSSEMPASSSAETASASEVSDSDDEQEAIRLCEDFKKKAKKLIAAQEGSSLTGQRGFTSILSSGLASVSDIRGSLQIIAKAEGAEIQSLDNVRGNVFICGMNIKSLSNSNGNLVVVGGNIGDISNFKGNLRMVGGTVTGNVVNSVGSYFAKNP